MPYVNTLTRGLSRHIYCGVVAAVRRLRAGGLPVLLLPAIKHDVEALS